MIAIKELDMPSLNISLTEELLQLVQSKVASGMYNNASEFIREAIRNANTNDEILYELKLTRLKEALKSGVEQAESGNFAHYSLENIMQELDQK